MIKLHPGDIIFVQGSGWLSNTIRKLTRSPGEKPTWVSHCAIAIDQENIVEALQEGVVVRKMPYADERVRIYRSRNIPPSALIRIAVRAHGYVGKPYGWIKIAAHALDGFLGGLRVFRRLIFMSGWPICSYVVAEAYASEGYDFGIDYREATPDDLMDYCKSHLTKYKLVA